ncbi:MAG: hypothetical protein ACXWZ8_09410 [Gaiellaceae bacterium]
MSNGAFILALAAGAALLAIWGHTRFPSLAPERLWRTALHLGLALAAVNLAPNALSSHSVFLVVFLFVLPALVYVFMSTLWMLRFAQAAMGVGR